LNDMYKCRLRPIGVPSPSLISDFRRLINDPETSDVCFLVEGKEVRAHRAILAVRSEYFRAMLFNGHMRESAPNAHIEISDVSHSVFLKILEFLYTDTVNDVSLDLGIHLMVASELFLLDRLKAISEDIIRGEITVDNVISILVASHQHNALGLKEIALEFILRNLSDGKIQAGLTELKAEPDLLVEIIKLSSLQPVSASPRHHATGVQQHPQHAQVLSPRHERQIFYNIQLVRQQQHQAEPPLQQQHQHQQQERQLNPNLGGFGPGEWNVRG